MNKTEVNKNILYNKYLLYFLFIISFGNFFIELMKGNMYFVAIYILIGFLTSFFNKNMIVILSMAVIFANVLNYGRNSTLEGYEDKEKKEKKEKNYKNKDDDEDKEKNQVDKVLGTKSTNDDGIIDELVEQDNKKHKKKKKKHSGSDSDREYPKKKEGLTQLTDQAILDMNYKKAENLMSQQQDILKNLKEYKPFLETIQGIAKNSGFAKDK